MRLFVLGPLIPDSSGSRHACVRRRKLIFLLSSSWRSFVSFVSFRFFNNNISGLYEWRIFVDSGDDRAVD